MIMSMTAHQPVLPILNIAAACTDEECFIFRGYRSTVRINGRTIGAARMVWEIAKGSPAPADAFILHTCHNGHNGCINIRHLYVGDQTQNMADRKAIGRYSVGGDNPSAKLTATDVRTIRERRRRGDTLKAIAVDYGVHFSTISLIDRRKKWGWLD